MEKNEDVTLKSLRACRDILDRLFEEHGGRIFNTAGDSVLAEFQSAVSAVICATEFQKLIKQRNLSTSEESQPIRRWSQCCCET
jgi:adenylate cyclase